MTKQETTKVLAMVKTAYPNSFKGITKTEAENTIELWEEMITDNFDTVNKALKKWISQEKFAPTIADIKTKIVEIKEQERINKWDDLYDN